MKPPRSIIASVAHARSRYGTSRVAKAVLISSIPPHGDDDQIVPIADSALSAKIVKGATLKVYKGAPHGMPSTLKDEINADLLTFFQQGKQAAA